MADIFISYAREDETRIRELVRSLEEHGWSIFWDRPIPVGKTWQSYIGQALSDAKCVIVAWSVHSVTSSWVIEEANDAKDRGILVPVFLESVKPPLGFRGIQAADLIDWEPGHSSPNFDQLIQDIAGIIGVKPPTPPPEEELTARTQPVDFPKVIPTETPPNKPTSSKPESLKAPLQGPKAIKLEFPELGKKRNYFLTGTIITIALAIVVGLALWASQKPRSPETGQIETKVIKDPEVPPKDHEVPKPEMRPIEPQAPQPKAVTETQTKRTFPSSSDTGADRLSSFRISIMSGERCIVEWRPKEPNMSEATLSSYGVDISVMKWAIAKITAAVLKRNPADVSVLQGEKSEVMPGAAYRLSSLGVNDDRYDSFHVYVTESEVSVSLFKSGQYLKRIEPSGIGIDWPAFKEAVAAALNNLYHSKYEVSFGAVGIKTYTSGEWHYTVPYMLREKPKGG